jgi:aspartate racemase
MNINTSTKVKSMVQELLSELRELDIRLWVEGDQLRYKAPKDALTPERLAQLLEHKAAILTFLQQAQMSEGSDLPTITKVSRKDALPLSFAQQRLWFLDQLEPNSPFYNIPAAVRLQGDLNLEVLQQALDALVAHHEILRTNYISENGNPIQVITAPQSVELPINDLQQYGEAQQETQLQKLLQQESQRPFNLASDLMLRGCLLQLAPQEHVLLLVMHHIASDGWSMGILWEQLTQLYQAFLAGKPNPLFPLPVQYADYAVWQREWLTGEVLDKQLNYWQQQLAGGNPVLELPTDRPRPPVQTYRGASQSLTLPQNLSEGLQQLCRKEGVTLYMTLLAAFQTLLYRYSRQEDILVGSPIAGRNRAELEGLIGFFVNTLVLRTDLSGNPSFRQLLQRVRSVTLDAYAHQDLPFEKLVEQLQPERSLSYNPLFQVMFALENTPAQAGQLLGLTETPVPLETATAKFDLTLSVIEQKGEIVGCWEYNTDLFEAATIERMTLHFRTLLEGIVTNPEQPISHLPLLTADERQQLLVDWNDTYTEYPQDKCIHQLFEEQVERTPDAVAVVFEEEQLTYQELNNRANQLAHYLQQLGVGPEVLVGICLERSLEMMVALLGILKAGGAYVPLDPAYPAERLAYMVADAKISVLVTQNKWTSQLPEHQAPVICLDSNWDKIALESQENPTQTNTGENLAYVIYTSGSTGKPKGVMISHQALSCFTQTAIAEYQLTASDRVLQFASINFDAAVEEIYPCLCTGATLILRTDRMLVDLPTFFQTCETWQLTVLDLPTAYWHQLAAELANTNVVLPESLRLTIVGGERVLPEPVKSWQEYVVKSGKSECLQLINTYGPTETTVSATLYRIPSHTSSVNREVPIGRPLAHLQTYILDSHLQPVPIGVPGELHIGGDSLAKGYLNRPELTAEKFIPNPFSQEPGARLYKTGDKVRYLPDGNIEFLGRIDNQVKIRGFRIELGEIETIVSQHPGIRETVVIAREDIPGDKRLVAYVVPQQQPPHSSQLRSFLQERLPNYMVPSAFVFLDTMPLTPNGKVDRRALPAPEQTRQELEAVLVSPRNEVELQLTKIWEKVLNIEPISIRDNFFALGGHSLVALRLFAQIKEKFARDLPITTLFQAPTIEQLASILNQDNQSSAWPNLVAIQPNGSRRPFFFVHGAAGGLLQFQKLAQHIGTDQPFYGLEAIGMDGKQPIPETIEEMAAHYIQEIRAFQPEAPYLLGGLCFGGKVALEMAQQLQAQEQEVALLVLFNTFTSDAIQRLPLWQRFSNHLINLLQKGPAFAINKTQGKINWLRNRYRENLKNRRMEMVIKSAQTSGRILSYQERHLPVAQAHLKADETYIPKTYSGKVILFQTEGDLIPPEGYSIDPQWGWGKFAGGGLEIYVVPGGHNAVFTDVNIPAQAEKLRACLDKVHQSLEADSSNK